MHKSMGPNNRHLRVLGELAGVVAELLSIIVEKSLQSGKVHIDWRKGSITPLKKSNKVPPGTY